MNAGRSAPDARPKPRQSNPALPADLCSGEGRRQASLGNHFSVSSADQVSSSCDPVSTLLISVPTSGKRVHSKGSVHGGEVGQQEPDKAHHITPSVRKQSGAGEQRGIESEERKKHWG